MVTSKNSVGENSATSVGRRGWLQSAAFAAASALAFPGSRVLAQGVGVGQGTSSSAPSDQRDSTRPFRQKMIGFMLAHEQFPVPQLLELAIAAEEAGFDLLATSDHFQPWQADEGHAGEAWATMAALGQRTRRVWIGPTVTCPTFRYNPGVVAEAFATLWMQSCMTRLQARFRCLWRRTVPRR